MATFYLDPENGNDANDGTSFANRWKSLTSGATAARIAPGDTIRMIKSEAPGSLGNATWTNKSDTVSLSSAVNALVTDCETAWTGSANVTATAGTTTYVTGTKACNLVIASGFTTGKVAYFALGASQDYSGYEGLTFWFQNSAAIAASTLSIRLCSDTTGDVTVDTLAIPASVYNNTWRAIYIDKGSALGSAIQSIALYADLDPGAVTVILDNISTVKASSGSDNLNLTNLIGKDTTNDGWWPIREISGTTIKLASNVGLFSSPTGLTYQGYWGTSETVTTYRTKPMLGPLTGGVLGLVQDSGTDGNLITFSGGWDRTNMSTQTGMTWLTSHHQRINNVMFDINTKSYIRVDKIGVTMTGTGVQVSGSHIELGTVEGSGVSSNGVPAVVNWAQNVYNLKIESLLAASCLNVMTCLGVNRGLYVQSFIAKSCGIGSSSAVIHWAPSGSTAHDSLTFDNIQMYNTNGNTWTWTGFPTITNLVVKQLTIDTNYGTAGAMVGLWLTGHEIFADYRLGDVSISNCVAEAVAYGGGYGTIKSLTTSGNTAVFDLAQSPSTGLHYVEKVTHAEGTLISNGTDYFGSGGWLWLRDVNGTDVHKGYHEARGLTVVPETGAARHTASGLAWKWSTTTNTLYTSLWPAKYKVADVWCRNGVAQTITVWARRSNTDVFARLRVYEAELTGVSRTDDTITAAADTYEQLSITVTATEDGPIGVWLEVYCSGTSAIARDVYFDDFAITDIAQNIVTLDYHEHGLPFVVGTTKESLDLSGLDYSYGGAPFYAQLAQLDKTQLVSENTILVTAPSARAKNVNRTMPNLREEVLSFTFSQIKRGFAPWGVQDPALIP